MRRCNGQGRGHHAADHDVEIAGFGGLHHFKGLGEAARLIELHIYPVIGRWQGVQIGRFVNAFIGAKWQIYICQSFLFAGGDRLLEKHNVMRSQ